MTTLYLLEPAEPGPTWIPFHGARPLAEARAGAWLIRERWSGVLGGLEAEAILGTHALDFVDTGSPPVVPPFPVAGPAIIAASWFAPSGAPVELAPDTRRLVHEEVTVAWIVAEGETWAGAEDVTGRAQPVDGLLLHGAYDLVTALEHLLPPDCADFLTEASDPIPDGSIVLGDPTDVILLGAHVEPGVIFDVRQGVVVLEDGVVVRAGARLEGPLYVGAGSAILGGIIRQSVIGPQCRVHGEITSCIFLGYANKSHDGFVGHSVIGQWVNLGAGTITSNLKNTYGPIRLDLPDGRVDTGRMFLGTLFGDHVKTAIGTLLGTGTVLGAGAHLFGPGPVPRYVAPFAWGMTGERLAVDPFVTIAGRVMPRRQVELTAEREASLRALHRRLAR